MYFEYAWHVWVDRRQQINLFPREGDIINFNEFVIIYVLFEVK